MAEFTLKKREADTLKLNIGEDSFEIPLATSLTLEEATAVRSMDGAIDFFNKYISEEVAKTLTLLNYRDIIAAWTEASKKSTEGVTPGES